MTNQLMSSKVTVAQLVDPPVCHSCGGNKHKFDKCGNEKLPRIGSAGYKHTRHTAGAVTKNHAGHRTAQAAKPSPLPRSSEEEERLLRPQRPHRHPDRSACCNAECAPQRTPCRQRKHRCGSSHEGDETRHKQ